MKNKIKEIERRLKTTGFTFQSGKAFELMEAEMPG